MCWSRFSLRLSIIQSRLTCSDIGSGFKRLMRPLVPWRFRVDTRTFSAAEIRSAQQKAMAARLSGSSRLSGNTIPITSSAPPFRYRQLAHIGRRIIRELLGRGGRRHADLVLEPRVAACTEKHTAPAVPARSTAHFPSGNVASQFITSPRLGRFGP